MRRYYMEDCCVCLEPYNSNNFSILPCKHPICFKDYLTLHSRCDMLVKCPICRREIHTIHLRLNPYPKKLKLKEFSKIKRHLEYKYGLPIRHASRFMRLKYQALRIALVSPHL